MAKLDQAISRLFAARATDLYLQTDAVPTLRTQTGSVALLKQALTTAQIVGAVAELCPAPRRAGFPVEGRTVFRYASPAGVVDVEFQMRAERVTAVLRRNDETAKEVHLEDLLDAPNLPRAPTARPDADGPCMPIPIRRAVEQVVVPEAQPAPAAPPPGPAPRAMAVAPALVAARASSVDSLLQTMVERKASDLHLSTGHRAMLRVDGDIVPLSGEPFSSEQLRALLLSFAPPVNREEFERRSDTDFSYQAAGARFRVNLFVDRNGPGAVIRQIPTRIPTAQELQLPPPLLELCGLQKGLVLVTGPTGSGKSTTLAAMIDHVNRTRRDHIITIEDPIEFVHPSQGCLVNQREVRTHTESFKQALRAALREDPDVLLVGELRDLETISMAIETAETGHLVFATLHTNSAPSTVDRVIDQFPTDRQAQVRTMLSESLRGVVSQTLCKRTGGGRVAAQEILLVTPSVSNLIREGKTFQLPSVLQTGRALGMCTMNDALLDLVRRNLLEPQEALKKSTQRAELKAALERSGFNLEASAAPVASHAA